MAVQIKLPAIDGIENKTSYFDWLCSKSGLSGPLAFFLFDNDFVWELEDDVNRAKDGISLREQYSEEVGKDLDKNIRDKLHKSIHGQCSYFEMILAVAEHLNEMLNDGEESLVPTFFEVLLTNAGLDLYDEEDYDQVNGEEICTDFWARKTAKIGIFEEFSSLFGKTKVNNTPSQKSSIWSQMNAWIDENTDEDGYFCLE